MPSRARDSLSGTQGSDIIGPFWRRSAVELPGSDIIGLWLSVASLTDS